MHDDSAPHDAPAADPAPASREQRLGELARLFFKLGVIGFGGPAAHIAMMEDEVVERRRWLSRQHFLDLIGATNLIPGPNSTEMTMHVGYARAGWLGLAVAGTSFIVPAALSTGILAWAYVEYGTLPAVEPFLVGIKPAVLAVILGALWRLGKKAIKGWMLAVLGAAVGALLLAGVSEIAALVVGGVIGMGVLVAVRRSQAPTPPSDEAHENDAPPDDAHPDDTSSAKRGWLALLPIPASALPALALPSVAASVPLWQLGLFFFKVGAVLYGSGYVLIAFLEGDLVDGYGWLTQQQLLDAVAIGQFTPGPVLTTATFIGYVLGGVPGAIIATLGIFLPAFVFAGLLHPIVPKLRKSVWTAAFLDAVNAAAVALMAVVTLQLGLSVLDGWLPITIFAVAAVLALRYKINAAWLVLGGALAGWLLG
ncbi:MAG: chromate efflux transporter [Bacteroidota bacterium]